MASKTEFSDTGTISQVSNVRVNPESNRYGVDMLKELKSISSTLLRQERVTASTALQNRIVHRMYPEFMQTARRGGLRPSDILLARPDTSFTQGYNPNEIMNLTRTMVLNSFKAGGVDMRDPRQSRRVATGKASYVGEMLKVFATGQNVFGTRDINEQIQLMNQLKLGTTGPDKSIYHTDPKILQDRLLGISHLARKHRTGPDSIVSGLLESQRYINAISGRVIDPITGQKDSSGSFVSAMRIEELTRALAAKAGRSDQGYVDMTRNRMISLSSHFEGSTVAPHVTYLRHMYQTKKISKADYDRGVGIANKGHPDAVARYVKDIGARYGDSEKDIIASMPGRREQLDEEGRLAVSNIGTLLQHNQLKQTADKAAIERAAAKRKAREAATGRTKRTLASRADKFTDRIIGDDAELVRQTGADGVLETDVAARERISQQTTALFKEQGAEAALKYAQSQLKSPISIDKQTARNAVEVAINSGDMSSAKRSILSEQYGRFFDTLGVPATLAKFEKTQPAAVVDVMRTQLTQQLAGGAVDDLSNYRRAAVTAIQASKLSDKGGEISKLDYLIKTHGAVQGYNKWKTTTGGSAVAGQADIEFAQAQERDRMMGEAGLESIDYAVTGAGRAIAREVPARLKQLGNWIRGAGNITARYALPGAHIGRFIARNIYTSGSRADAELLALTEKADELGISTKEIENIKGIASSTDRSAAINDLLSQRLAPMGIGVSQQHRREFEERTAQHTRAGDMLKLESELAAGQSRLVDNPIISGVARGLLSVANLTLAGRMMTGDALDTLNARKEMLAQFKSEKIASAEEAMGLPMGTFQDLEETRKLISQPKSWLNTLSLGVLGDSGAAQKLVGTLVIVDGDNRQLATLSGAMGGG